MKLLAIIIFSIVSGLHLNYIFRNDLEGKRSTKPLIVPSLMLIYITSCENFLSKFLLTGLLFCFYGDYLLIFVPKEYTFFGAISFGIGHIYYIKAFLDLSDKLLYFTISHMIMFVIYVVYVLCIYQFFFKYSMKKVNKSKLFGAGIYIIVIMTMSLIAYSMVVSQIPGMKFTYIGTILFIISDTLFAYRHIVKRNININFLIMVTYIVAQLLIVTGFILHC